MITVNKWKEIIKYELGKEIVGNKFIKIKNKVCIKYEEDIIGMKGLSKLWIKGTVPVLKNGLEKHVKRDPYLHAANLKKNKNLGANTYSQEVVSSPIGRGLAKMAEKDKQTFCK